MKISVLPIGPFNKCFQYESEVFISVGTIVGIPFGTRSVLGVVTDENADTDRELKQIQRVFPYNIGVYYMNFINWVSNYTLIPRGIVLKMILAEKTVFTCKKGYESPAVTKEKNHDIILNDQQQKAFHALQCNKASVPFLLEGVTGSGKTEVYLKKAKEIFDQGKQVLILFPEIALTRQIYQRIEKYFGLSPIVWNSSVTPKNRRIAWIQSQSKSACIVIGARSALFIPFQNLGLIIVDEEHDSSYKQEEGYFYNARDMAVVLAQILHIPIILSSATPSLESYVNASSSKYGHFLMSERYGNSQLPDIKLIDMRQNKFDGFISPPLILAIQERLKRKEQTLLYLNRRGYSPITLCKNCGEKISCPNCSSWLVYHKKDNNLICHYCGHKESVPSQCFHCKIEKSYIPFGPGVERIFEELQRKLPKARIEIASSDTFSSDKNANQIICKILSNDIDIIIGTQILAKGHHFPNITLVGIVDGDLGLQGADLRSAERTYQLINQVAGRAGRSDKPGEILIQTFKSEHPFFETLKKDPSANFMEMEVANRKKMKLPPFTKFASIIISGTNRELTEKIAKKLRSTCPKNIYIFGPAPAPMFVLRGRVRWRILLKSFDKKALNTEISSWITSVNVPKNVKIQVDIDPVTFL